MVKRVDRHRHAWLLTTLVVSEIGQPLLAGENLYARAFAAVVVFAVAWVVVSKLLQTKRQRWLGTALILPAFAVELGHYAVPRELQTSLSIVFSASAALFMAYAISVILREIFSKRNLEVDDVIGAFSGYLMIAVFFGNLYLLTWRLAPDAFSIDPHVTWQLTEWHTRRGLFAYFSFATMASVGYGDITTTAPASNTLVWLEVMFGQFYMAVVVATIVGTKVALAFTPKDPGDQ